jgi:hypothetical protein
MKTFRRVLCCSALQNNTTAKTQDASTQTDSISTSTKDASVATDEHPQAPVLKFADQTTQTPLSSSLFRNINNEDQFSSCTGINLFHTFFWLLSVVENYTKKRKKCILILKDQILLTLMKLKLNSLYTFLSVCFGINQRTCCRYFRSMIPIFSLILKNFILCPSCDSMQDNLPYSFAPFPSTILVLDCTEIPVCSASCIACRTQMWSQYKKRHTLKTLIAVTPGGMIVYNGPFYGGKAFDNFLFKESKLLNSCKPGDSIMVDKGFRIEEDCRLHGVHLIRPAFKENDEQLGYEDCDHSRMVALARVHVEWVMERLKNFRILQDKIQWNYLELMDDILIVICGLVNLSPPIISENAFEY